jgi:superfamily II DNA or RNA helicase
MLRADQQNALDVLRESVRDGKKRICLQCPTAWGKTVLASEMVANALIKKRKVMFTVPAISLIDQTVDMFARAGILDVGVIQASHNMTNWDMPIQVCSVQTLMRKKTLPKVDFVIMDECHIWFTFYEKWLGTPKDRKPEWENVPVIGLSATPWRKGHGAWFDHYYKASTIRQMITAGTLSDFRVYAPSHPDLTGVRSIGGDYHEGELSERMRESFLVADAVETWLRLWGKDRTLCYAVDRAHAMKLKLQFEAAGVPCGYQDHTTSDADRARLRRDFHSGKVKVVCNVETLTTGIDWDVRCISLNRPTKSDMLFVQIIGRGLRTAPPDTDPKDSLLILDHSDNHLRLGFVTDVDESYVGLHDGRAPRHDNRASAIRLPKECPRCGYLKLPKMALCPGCGFVAKVVSKIEPEAGELRELRPKPKPEFKMNMQDKTIVLSELRAYAQQQKYKDGWASNQYRDVFGVWPDNSLRHTKPALIIRPETLSWIKSRAIAWAKSKRNFYANTTGGKWNGRDG